METNAEIDGAGGAPSVDAHNAELVGRRDALLVALSSKLVEINSFGKWFCVISGIFLIIAGAFNGLRIIFYAHENVLPFASLFFLGGLAFLLVRLTGRARFLILYLLIPLAGITINDFVGVAFIGSLFVFGPVAASFARRYFPFTEYSIKYGTVSSLFMIFILGSILVPFYYVLPSEVWGIDKYWVGFVYDFLFFIAWVFIFATPILCILNKKGSSSDRAKKLASISIVVFFIGAALLMICEQMRMFFTHLVYLPYTDKFLEETAFLLSFGGFCLSLIGGLSGILMYSTFRSWRENVKLEVKRLEIETGVPPQSGFHEKKGWFS